MKDFVYIAGPINSDSCGTYKNVHNMSKVAIEVMTGMGASVYAPSNDLILGIVSGDLDYEQYTENDFPILAKADCMFLTGNWKDSKGCLAELEFCKQNNIPYFTEFWDLYDFIRRPTILCIIGESGSGKTYMAEYIESEYNIPMIQSYTTREPRFEGENGHTFISLDEFNEIDKNDMIAYTCFGGNHYCCKHSDVLKKNTYIIDEHGYSMLRNQHKDKYKVIGVRIKSSPEHRNDRDVSMDRIKRDEGMFVLHSLEFDHIISNNGSLKDFKSNINKIVEEVFR
jgi:guanylate kinase